MKKEDQFFETGSYLEDIKLTEKSGCGIIKCKVGKEIDLKIYDRIAARSQGILCKERGEKYDH